MQHLTKQGYLDKDGEIVQNPMMDELFLDNEAITLASTCSIAGKIAFGVNARKYVTRIGSGFGYLEEIPLTKGKRCYSVDGFSLHCNTAVNTHARDRLEKLAAIIPPPKSHLVRWGGVFVSSSPLRKKIFLNPGAKTSFEFGADGKKLKNKSWRLMLSRVFKIDVLKCDCGGDLKPLEAIQDPDQVRKYLKDVNIEYEPPVRGPPRLVQDSFEFDLAPQFDDYEAEFPID